MSARTSDTSRSGSPSICAQPGRTNAPDRDPGPPGSPAAPQPSILLFLDGVGIGERDPEFNPFFQARLPTLRGALGGTLPSLDLPTVRGPDAVAFPLDACLGVPGIPQSGTGQIALLTGENAPERLGRHFGPWPPVPLRPLLEEANLLRRALTGGARVAFANAYPTGFPGARSSRRVAAPPLAALSAGLLDRNEEALAQGRAVASEIVNARWRGHLPDLGIPEVTAEEAGVNLARIAATTDLTLFAHYDTDHAGHRGGMEGAVAALERVDRFLAGLLSELTPGTLLLIASDHGNLEDIRVGHTRNPALGVAFASPLPEGEVPARITEIPDFILARILPR